MARTEEHKQLPSDASPEPAAAAPEPGPYNPEKPSVLLEDGRESPVAKGTFSSPDGHDFRVHDDASNADYEHCATRPDGRWIYRPVSKG